MVLVSHRLGNHVSLLQTKLSDGEGHEARCVGLEAMPLDEYIELTFRTLFRTFAAIFEEPPVEGGSGAIARRSHAP